MDRLCRHGGEGRLQFLRMTWNPGQREEVLAAVRRAVFASLAWVTTR